MDSPSIAGNQSALTIRITHFAAQMATAESEDEF